MALLAEKDRKLLAERFAEMTGSVKLVVFTEAGSRLIVPGDRPCRYCQQTVELVQEVGGLSERIQVEVLDRRIHLDQAQAYGVDKVPAIVVTDPEGQRKGVRYFGIPAGYEFGALVEDILDTGNGQTRLAETTRRQLAEQVKGPVHLKVFVTPTCPYCPRAVRLAHQFAMESPHIVADMIEAQESPELAQQYQVYGVPKTIINEEGEVEGAVPEAHFLRAVLDVLTVASPKGETDR